jgi:ATP-dependent Clp protease ATP-binding subunit ClpA
VSFKNTIIILTSNLGSSAILETGADREYMREMVMEAVSGLGG